MPPAPVLPCQPLVSGVGSRPISTTEPTESAQLTASSIQSRVARVTMASRSIEPQARKPQLRTGSSAKITRQATTPAVSGW